MLLCRREMDRRAIQYYKEDPVSPFETDLNDGSEENRGNPADAVQGKKDAEEDIATAEQAADEELQHLDQPGNTLDDDAAAVDPAVDQTDEFRNPPRTVY